MLQCNDGDGDGDGDGDRVNDDGVGPGDGGDGHGDGMMAKLIGVRTIVMVVMAAKLTMKHQF